MRIYLASKWEDRDIMPQLAEQIEEAGHRITHKWWQHEDHEGTYPSNIDSAFYTQCAWDDFNGVASADALIVFNSGKSEGKAVETGIALTMGIPVVVIGVRSNIFHYLDGVRMVWSVAEALEAVE